LLSTNALSNDAKERVKRYRSLITPVGIHIITYFVISILLGAYTSNSKGYNYVRE
jgi:hypothetical protein